VVAQNIFFGIIAFTMVVAAIRVVTCNNVVHAALWLVVVLGGAAMQYILLIAPFVATTQILVYVGAIMVLFLFGSMLTRSKLGLDRDLNNRHRAPAALVALALAGILGYVLIDAFRDDELPKDAAVTTTAQVSDAIFSTYLLPFWALSFVLTVAVIGAIVLARRD
jgi:NADH-quinone oxidoreductase subunit J